MLNELNVTTGKDWRGLAAALTKALTDGNYTTRDDIVCKVIEPEDTEYDAERFPIAWHIPTTADIALNATKITGVLKNLRHAHGTAQDYNPSRLSGLADEYSEALKDHRKKGTSSEIARTTIGGVLAHEAAHSMYSTYITEKWYKELATKETPVAEAISLLEELRIERLQIKRSKTFRKLLRFSADMVMPTSEDIAKCVVKDEDGKTAGVDVVQLVTPVALILGRKDAGVLNGYEVKDFEDIVEDVFPTDMLGKMKGLWNEFIALNRADEVKMTDIGRRWVELMKSELGDAYGMDLPGLMKMLGEALEGMAEEAREWLESEGSHAPDEPAIPEEELARISKPSHGYTPGKDNGPWSSRQPTAEERRVATEFARRLEQMSYRARTETKIKSILPPGRLSTRSAVAAAADRAQGRATTAEPWSRKTRKHVDTPPLRVGIMTDVSGSMSWAVNFVASSAWIVNKAVRHINGKSGSVVFGNLAEKIVGPGDKHGLVVTHTANGGSEAFNNGCASLDGMLGLSDPRNGARLLFVVSDGCLVAEGEMPAAAKWVERLTRSGCVVIWASRESGRETYAGLPCVPRGAHGVRVSKPDDLRKSFNIIADATQKAIRGA